MIEKIKTRATAVKAQIEQATVKANRPLDSVTLVSVTKTWPAEVLLDAYKAGLRHFGENRTNELEEKRQFLENELGKENGITWHFYWQSTKSKS